MTGDEAEANAGDSDEETRAGDTEGGPRGADADDVPATGAHRETGEQTDADTGDGSIRDQARSLRAALADEVDAPAEQDDHAAAARKSDGDARE